MSRNKNLAVLSEVEKFALYELPDFDNKQRREYFSFSKKEIRMIMSSPHIQINIFFALQLSYFKAKKIFYKISWSEIPEKDLLFLIDNYFPDKVISTTSITNYQYYNQQKTIVDFFSYRLWSKSFLDIVDTKIVQIIKRDTAPNFIAHELLDFLNTMKIVRPAYSTLQIIISKNLSSERKRLCTILDTELQDEHKLKLDALITSQKPLSDLASLKQDAKNFGFNMMLEERKKHNILEALYPIAQTIILKSNISQQNINYYTNLANHHTIRSLRNLKFNQNYLYILCYVFKRYQQLNDNLIEAFTYHVKKFETNIRAKVKSNFVDETPEEQQKIGKLLLLYVDAGFTDKSLYTDICKRAFQIMPEATILSLGQSLISKPQQKKEFKWKQIDLNQYRYKKNLRPIFMKLNFASESADNPWLKSALWLQKIFINNDKLSDQLYSQCPNNIIPKHLHSYLLDNSTDNDKKIIANRYEYWLYSQISKQINNSQIYINNSNNYRSFNHKLASDKEKEQVLQTLNIPWFATSIENQLEILKKELDALWRLFNQGLKNNKFKHLSYDKKNQKLLYTKPKSDHHKKLQKKFFKQFPFCNINNVFKFVDADCGFLSALTPLQPRYAKKETYNKDKLIAAILALAFNYGNYKMSEISDLSYQELETANQQHLRLETLKKANDILSNAIAKLKIFPYYSLDFDLLYSSVDGQKFELNTPNLKARYSRKYLREGEGVSAYTILANHVPLECEIIGTHEHESYFLFDVWYNNTSDISPDIITGDMHVINKANFAIMKCFGAQVNPRFTDFNRQLKHLYCTSSLSKYKNFLIKPVAQIEHNIIIKQKSNIDQIIATLAMKKTSQANLIKKLCHLPATNDLKKAIFEYDKLVRSTYTLKYMMDSKLQKTVNKSQNRIESYHQLRAAISKVGGKKQLYGKTDIDVEISNQCNRLVCNTIIYYNSIILSRVLEKYDTQNNKKKLLSIIKRISPISWHHHIHFSGQYTFQGNDSTIDIDEFLKNFNLDL